MRTETILGIIIVLAVFVKYAFNLPFAGPVLVITMSLLSLIYFPGGIYFLSDKRFKNQNMAMSIFAGLAYAAGIMGILFKFMYWPGSANMIQSALIFSGIALVISLIKYFQYLNKSEDNLEKIEDSEMKDPQNYHPYSYYRKLATRGMIVVFFTLFIGLIPIKYLISFQYRNDSEKARLLIQTIENPHNQQYKKEYRDYLNKERNQK